MAHCEYWFSEGSDQFCDLAGDTCRCSGSDSRCTYGEKSIALALKEEEKMTLDDAALRVRRRRSDRMAG